MWIGWFLACRPPAPDDVVTLAQRGERVDLAPDGDALWASWAERTDDGYRAWVAELGATAAPRLLPADPVIGVGRKPRIAAHDDRVVAVWSTGDPRASTVQVASARGDEPFTAEVVAVGGPDEPWTLVDQPEPLFRGDALWVVYKAEVDHPDVALFMGAEADAWAPIGIPAVPGVPCECCPHRVDESPDGALRVVIRNNQRDLREIWFASAPAGGLAFRATQVSRTGWIVPGCPFDGPRLAELDGALRVTWVDPTRGAAEPWFSESVDGGTSWGPDTPLLPPMRTVFQEPVIAAYDGAFWLAVEEVFVGAWLFVDRGTGFEPVDVPVALFDVELAATDDGLWLAPSGVAPSAGASFRAA